MTQKALFPVTLKKLTARELLDSRGFPTVEAEIEIESSGKVVLARAIVPSGASTGEGEALELRDQDAKRYLGKGVLTAVENIRGKIAGALVGREISTQTVLDRILLDLDGTPSKSALGANALLAVSMAFCRAQASIQNKPLFQWISELQGTKGTMLPVPLMNILNGGKHADNGLAVQEFMIVPYGFDRFSEALRAGTEVFHRLKKILAQKGLSTAVGDEGGFAPAFEGEKPHEQALACVLQAITDAGYTPGKQIAIALDCAASEFVDKAGSTADSVFYLFEGKKRSTKEMISIYQKWKKEFPIVSIEDGLSEHDWKGWVELTTVMGSHCQLVGDDLFVTNPIYLKKGIEQQAANSILIKLNQIGTVSETLETMQMASQAHMSAVSSHRSGETEDTFIADLAVGTDCGQIKTGSASRTDRIAKYNQLLRIEEALGGAAKYAGRSVFSRLN